MCLTIIWDWRLKGETVSNASYGGITLDHSDFSILLSAVSLEPSKHIPI